MTQEEEIDRLVRTIDEAALRAERLGLTFAAYLLRKELAEGNPISLDGGRTVDPELVLGPPSGGKKLVIVGDTENCRWPAGARSRRRSVGR